MSLSFLAADISPLMVLSAIALVALIGGLLPASPLEPMLIGIASLASPVLTMQVVVLAAVAQMVPKTLVFLGSGKAVAALSPRKRAFVDRIARHLAGRRVAQMVTVFVSAVIGVPPFYLVTVVCGGLRLPVSDYLLAGIAGRLVRFSALATLPEFFGA